MSQQKKIIKRSGVTDNYKPYKIQDAISKAFKSESVEYDKSIFVEVVESLEEKNIWAVEEIQDLIEKLLFKHNYFSVMRSFMLYRHTHKLQREHVLGLNEDTTYINCTQTVEEYINGTDWRIMANANTGYSNAGLINNISGKVIANFWLDKIYSKEEGEAHRNGAYHIHDLDCLTGYCAGWSLRNLLNEGFNGVRGRVESRPPSHFREALGQMANFLGILQSEWAGAQAFSSFDTYLAPYVFKDNLTYEEVYKALRSFIYNLNVPARWGQSPFTNITIDWVVPDDLKDQFPSRNNRHLFENLEEDEELLERSLDRGITLLTDFTYKHFRPEMEMIVKAYYAIMTEGDSTGQPFTFPIPTVNITEDFDWDSPNADLLFANTAKIGSSYFQNFIGSQYQYDEEGNKVENPNAYKPNAVRSMCCRLQLDLRELLKRGNGLFGSAEMTGSIGVVTINMARLGYMYKSKEDLFEKLLYLLELAKSTLEKKRIFINKMFDLGLFPYTKRYLPHFNNHFSTIGVNGLNEMIRNFTNDQSDITTRDGMEFSVEILDFIRAQMHRFQSETGNLYNLEASPAEGATYRFAREDKKRFPSILQAGFGQNIYYTNSSQIPVDFTDDPFEALWLQDDLQCKYTGGTVLHLYMKEKVSSTEACKKLVRKVITNFRLPYITVTPVFSVCPKHGYLAGEHEYCPKCDDEIVNQYQDAISNQNPIIL